MGTVIYSVLCLRGEQHILLKSMSSVYCNQMVKAWKDAEKPAFLFFWNKWLLFAIDSFYIFIHKKYSS